MKRFTACLLALTITPAFAASLQDCEEKIVELLAAHPTTDVRLVEGGQALARVDSFHLKADKSCGVELAENAQGKFLTVSLFHPAAPGAGNALEQKKFETIILNGDDPTFTDRRVKAVVNCSMTADSVEYVTRVPVLTDGVRTPWVIERLNIRKSAAGLNVRLRASVTPINGVFRSISACNL